MKLSSFGTPDLLRKYEITFGSYWEQSAVQPYDPAVDSDCLDAALARNGGRQTSRPDSTTGLQIQPYLHQQEMLENLDAARTVDDQHTETCWWPPQEPAKR